MDINCQAYKTQDEVRQALEQHLAIDRSTVAEVQAFLREQGLESSPYVPEGTFKALNSNVDRQTTRLFDGRIVCRMPMPRKPVRGSIRHRLRAWLYSKIFISEYRCEFHFQGESLVEIIVAQEITGF